MWTILQIYKCTSSFVQMSPSLRSKYCNNQTVFIRFYDLLNPSINEWKGTHEWQVAFVTSRQHYNLVLLGRWYNLITSKIYLKQSGEYRKYNILFLFCSPHFTKHLLYHGLKIMKKFRFQKRPSQTFLIWFFWRQTRRSIQHKTPKICTDDISYKSSSCKNDGGMEGIVKDHISSLHLTVIFFPKDHFQWQEF